MKLSCWLGQHDWIYYGTPVNLTTDEGIILGRMVVTMATKCKECNKVRGTILGTLAINRSVEYFRIQEEMIKDIYDSLSETKIGENDE